MAKIPDGTCNVVQAANALGCSTRAVYHILRSHSVKPLGLDCNRRDSQWNSEDVQMVLAAGKRAKAGK